MSMRSIGGTPRLSTTRTGTLGRVGVWLLGALLLLPVGVSQASMPERPSIVILVHGVLSGGQPGRSDYAYDRFRAWARDALGAAEIVDFDWAHGRPDFPNQASIRVGHRFDQASGLSDTAWAGVAKLKEVVGRIRRQFGPEPRINVVAHSQGTVLSFAAAQEGLALDHLILMGSPLFQERVAKGGDGCHLPLVAQNVSGRIVNLGSRGDGLLQNVLPNLHPEVPGGSIGARGIPLQVAGFEVRHHEDRLRIWDVGGVTRLIDVELKDVPHSGNGGWWASEWLHAPKADTWPANFGRDDLIAMLASETPLAGDLAPVRAFAVTDHFTRATPDGFGASARRNRAAWEFTIPEGTMTGFHFDDKLELSYELEVIEGAVEYGFAHATWFAWEPKKVPPPVTIGPANGVVRGVFRTPNRPWVPFVRPPDATLWLKLTGRAPVTVVRCVVEARK